MTATVTQLPSQLPLDPVLLSESVSGELVSTLEAPKNVTHILKDAMLDLETLDTVESSVILSIGIIPFDPWSDAIGEATYIRPNLKEQTMRGRTIGINTIKWWMGQGDEAKAVFQSEGTMLYDQTIEELKRRCVNITKLWAKGPGFDCNILRHFFGGRKFLVPYNGDRCVRTVLDLHSVYARDEAYPDPQIKGMIEHHALCDSLYQIRQVQQCLRSLKPSS